MDISHLQSWIGRKEEVRERVPAFPATALAATMDREGVQFSEGDRIPPLCHWLHFLSACRQSEVGPDGHPKRGGFLPPVPLPRRMWAGSAIQFLAPITVGGVCTRISTIDSVELKSGRSGELVFVGVNHRIHDGDTVCLEERQDLVYREPPKPGAPAPAVKMAPDDADFSRTVIPDPVLLMRYTALTFNGHRIHYDRDYAVGTEGYSGLVVHGPLLATLLVDLLTSEVANAELASFEIRAAAPIFDTERFSIHGRCEPDGVTFTLWVRRPDGAQALTATAIIA